MIVSERHKFVFIKGMKVAGTSIEMALSLLCGPDDIITPLSQIDERERMARGRACQNYAADPAAERTYLEQLRAAPKDQLGMVPRPSGLYFNHMSLAALMQRSAKDFAEFQIVCAERSPYAKVLSWANMQLSYDAYRVGGEMRADPAALKAVVDKGFATGEIRHVRNIDRYRRPDGVLAAKPMRYSQLESDFDEFVRGLGETPPQLPHAKKGLMSDQLDPRAVLSPDQIARINRLFADEFQAFGYSRL